MRTGRSLLDEPVTKSHSGPNIVFVILSNRVQLLGISIAHELLVAHHVERDGQPHDGAREALLDAEAGEVELGKAPGQDLAEGIYTLPVQRALADRRVGTELAALLGKPIEGNALDMTATSGEHITLPEWGYLGRGKFQRRDFRYDALTQRSSIAGTLFEMLEEHEVFIPVATSPPMTVKELAE